MTLLDAVARRYGTRPSALLGITDDHAAAFSIDIHAAKWGGFADAKAARRGGP